MWNFIEANQFVVGALTGSLAAYLLGLLVTYVRREKRWLGYSVSSRNIVQKGHSKLDMKYDGQDITRLDSHTIQLRNIGNRSLTNLPIHLESVEEGKIVDFEMKPPEGAMFTCTLDDKKCITVTVDLLNPGEAFTVGMTIADAGRGEINVVARGEYLQVKMIGERVSTDELLEILMPALPIVGSLLFDLYRVSKLRERR